ncbi:MAG TPA: hypothetical protein VGU70_10510 [Methylobacterium sp.]|jgi:CBS domain-containing protein|uniref:hypothetical protein n=1 Tax=Methylorubrum sp. B1-46 TaxID=2897334 RepID=UPI001E64012D|nr:hypothetical protein [Methylorubrum sp. B1-46]UGB27087.1 hypothetical protein LPC10_05725 [Methylorubrum sp. B1-46]HEV2543174.1 hypothetical protein [Methylobacterium sp.]
MTTEVESLHPEMSHAQIAVRMARSGHPTLPVVEPEDVGVEEPGAAAGATS